jgi:hypothetical protein
MNLYQYCNSNPTTFVDPYGLKWSAKLGKWGLPLEIQLDKDPGEGVAAKTLGPFAILYGPTYRDQNPNVQESTRYHEYIHVGQWGWGFRDIWDKVTGKPYPSREMEAFVRERIYIKQKLTSKCLSDTDRKALEDELQGVDFMLQNSQYMWTW